MFLKTEGNIGEEWTSKKKSESSFQGLRYYCLVNQNATVLYEIPVGQRFTAQRCQGRSQCLCYLTYTA